MTKEQLKQFTVDIEIMKQKYRARGISVDTMGIRSIYSYLQHDIQSAPEWVSITGIDGPDAEDNNRLVGVDPGILAAAELTVLKDVDLICRQHNIGYAQADTGFMVDMCLDYNVWNTWISQGDVKGNPHVTLIVSYFNLDGIQDMDVKSTIANL